METWRKERDEMQGEKISLSSHLKGRYQIFSHVMDTIGRHVRPRNVRRDSRRPGALIVALLKQETLVCS